jgi:uncharacterized membrane protein YjjP (DUF1212 family)
LVLELFDRRGDLMTTKKLVLLLFIYVVAVSGVLAILCEVFLKEYEKQYHFWISALIGVFIGGAMMVFVVLARKKMNPRFMRSLIAGIIWTVLMSLLSNSKHSLAENIIEVIVGGVTFTTLYYFFFPSLCRRFGNMK